MGNCLCFRARRSKLDDPAKETGDLLPSSPNEKACFFGTCPSIARFLQRDQLRNDVPDRGINAGSGDVIIGKPSFSRSPIREQKDSEMTSNPLPLPVPVKDVEDFSHMSGHRNVQIFTYNQLKLATKNFRSDQILGEGGFGFVYKGAIDRHIKPGFPYTQVAVKELNPEGLQGDKEWQAEVNYLGNFSHPNLVKLFGYCCQDEHRLLVYEYMAGGSLENHLFTRGSSVLPWLTRIKIALDAAKGLAFLHGAKQPIIYRDFKTSNILLDAEHNGKLSDFGLAKEGPIGEQTHVSTRVMGTYGYAAPEYILTGHLTAKSDVYGFGVVLLELLIGRKTLDDSRPRREHNLVDWARPLLLRSNKLFQIIDPRVDGQYTAEILLKLSRLAYDCLSQNPKVRPHMSEAVTILADLLDRERSALRIAASPKVLEDAAAGTEKKRESAEHGRRASNPPGDGGLQP